MGRLSLHSPCLYLANVMVLCLSCPEQMQNIVFPDCGRMKSRGEEVSATADMSCIQFPCGDEGLCPTAFRQNTSLRTDP